MLTKYFLQIGEERYELTSENIRNWDQIQCAFSRKDFDGVIRSFSSKFEFVGKAYDLLLEYYLNHGVNAHALLTVLTITDRWEWEPQFEAPLDFSTITWDGLKLGISAIDNSLGALINARKSTKYEMVVGEDIISPIKLDFDRLLMSNTVAHEIMGNVNSTELRGSLGRSNVILSHSSNFKRVPTYVVGDAETYENSPISFQDETDDAGSYFLKVERNADFNLDIDISFSPICTLGATLNSAEIHLMQFNSANPNYNNSYVDLGTILSYNKNRLTYVGCYPTLEALRRAYPNPAQGCYAVIGKSTKYDEAEAVYITPFTNYSKVEWMQCEKGSTGTRGNLTATYSTRRFIYSFKMIGKPSGAMFGLFYKADITWNSSLHSSDPLVFGIQQTSIKANWESRAKTISIDSLNPITVAQTLINKIAESDLNVNVQISPYDTRIENTAILAAESVRGIPGAKFYSSFKEFCDFMQTVFGYTYYLGERKKSSYVGTEPFEGTWSLSEGDTMLNEVCPTNNISGAPSFIVGYNVFAVYNSNNGKFYTKWATNGEIKDETAYNDADGQARRDKVYILAYVSQPYYIDDDGILQSYSGDPELCDKDSQALCFVHRSELFTDDDVREIGMCRDLSYSVNNSVLYSGIEVGYDKQDYEAQCGRDEWNFTNHYTTGLDISTKTLSLKSKYRADCYGLEFLAQKRAKDSTDDKSDNTVFFVHCELYDGNSEVDEGEVEEGQSKIMKIKRSAIITGALSDTVFNGEYSPHRCLLANADYIAAMGIPTQLKFASSEGNSDIQIDGIGCNSDFTLDSQLFSCGEVSFTTGDVDFPKNPNALVSVTHKGVRYRGYLTSLTVRYARTEAAKYKLIVKDIELC